MPACLPACLFVCLLASALRTGRGCQLARSPTETETTNGDQRGRHPPDGLDIRGRHDLPGTGGRGHPVPPEEAAREPGQG